MTAFASIVLAALPGLGAKSGADGAVAPEGQGLGGAFEALMATLTAAAPAPTQSGDLTASPMLPSSPTPSLASAPLSSSTPLSPSMNLPAPLPATADFGSDAPFMTTRSPDAAAPDLLSIATVEPLPSGQSVEPPLVEAVLKPVDSPDTAEALAAAGTVLVAPTPTAPGTVATPESEPRASQGAVAVSPGLVADTKPRRPDTASRSADPDVPSATTASGSPSIERSAPSERAVSSDLPPPIADVVAGPRPTPLHTPSATATPIATASRAPVTAARLDAPAAARAGPEAVADVLATPDAAAPDSLTADAIAPDAVAVDVRATPPPGTTTPRPATDAAASLIGRALEEAAKPGAETAVRPAVARAAPLGETPADAAVDTLAKLTLHTAPSLQAPVLVDSVAPVSVAPDTVVDVRLAPSSGAATSRPATEAVTSLIGRVLDGVHMPATEAAPRQAVAEAARPAEVPVDAVVDTPVELSLDTALSPEAPVVVDAAAVETPAVPAPASSRRAARADVARSDVAVEAVDSALPELKPAARADARTAVDAPPAAQALPDLPPAPASVVDADIEPEQATLDTTAAAPTPQAAAEVPVETAPTRGSPETVARLVADIARKLEGKTTRFDIQLDPLGLGKVDVSIEINVDGRLTASLSFDSAQAAADLRGRAGELRQALEKAGFDLADGGLSFDMNNPGGSGGREAREPLAAWSSRAFQTAQSGLDQADALAARSPWSRTPSGGVDIRI